MRVVVDEAAIERRFDYVVATGTPARVGDPVRVDLGPRRLGGWIVDVDVDSPEGVQPRPIRRHGGHGPSPDLVELASWAARRWLGRPAQFLAIATPPRRIHHLPPDRRTVMPPPPAPSGDASAVVRRWPPAASRLPIVLEAAARGPTLVIVPSHRAVSGLVARLGREGLSAVSWPDGWADAAAGVDVVVGTRSAVWARVRGLSSIVVSDEHDEALRSERAPHWQARDVAAERARRQGVAFIALSPSPSLEALGSFPLVAPSRAEERAGWPIVEVCDRRGDAPGPGTLFSERLVELVRSPGRVVCVLNRTGVAGLLRCRRCDTVVACQRCGSAVEQPGEELACRSCGARRPVLCLDCGSTRLVRLRPGVARLADELSALVTEPVDEVTATSADPPSSRVVVGTEAALHRVARADVVIFLDIDRELLAPRFRAHEQAVWLIARAARLVGPRRGGGRVLCQTRVPDHEVLRALASADPGRLAGLERRRRHELALPPEVGLGVMTGAGAAAGAAELAHRAIGAPGHDRSGGTGAARDGGGQGGRPGVEVDGPAADGSFVLRAADGPALADAVRARRLHRRPDVRIELDPPRI